MVSAQIPLGLEPPQLAGTSLHLSGSSETFGLSNLPSSTWCGRTMLNSMRQTSMAVRVWPGLEWAAWGSSGQ